MHASLLTAEDFGFVPPTLPVENLRAIAAEVFTVQGTLKPLRGERDQYTLVTTKTGLDVRRSSVIFIPG